MKDESRNISLPCEHEGLVGCGNPAVVNRNGDTYCRVHDPDRNLPQEREGRGKAPRIGITIRLDPDVYHMARVAAVQEHKTVGSWIEQAIEQRMNGDERRI